MLSSFSYVGSLLSKLRGHQHTNAAFTPNPTLWCKRSIFISSLLIRPCCCTAAMAITEPKACLKLGQGQPFGRCSQAATVNQGLSAIRHQRNTTNCYTIAAQTSLLLSRHRCRAALLLQHQEPAAAAGWVKSISFCLNSPSSSPCACKV